MKFFTIICMFGATLSQFSVAMDTDSEKQKNNDELLQKQEKDLSRSYFTVINSSKKEVKFRITFKILDKTRTGELAILSDGYNQKNSVGEYERAWTDKRTETLSIKGGEKINFTTDKIKDLFGINLNQEKHSGQCWASYVSLLEPITKEFPNENNYNHFSNDENVENAKGVLFYAPFDYQYVSSPHSDQVVLSVVR